MKYTFEIEDIKVGAFIIKQDVRHDCKDMNYKATVTYKIGFMADTREYCLISALTDGMVLRYPDKESVLDVIEKDGGYRPLPNKELVEIIEGRNV